MSNQDFANASNEKKEQRIMYLRNDYNNLKIITVSHAAQKYGYTKQTITKWAKQGDIPLIIDNQNTVVPLTSQNRPTKAPQVKDPIDLVQAFIANQK